MGQPRLGLLPRRVEDDATSVHEHDPLGEPERAPDALLGEDDRHVETGHDVEEGGRALGIELCGRLVEEEELRVESERRRETDSLELAPGELGDVPVGEVGCPDLLQGVRFFGGGARTHSLVMAYQAKQVRFVDTVHMFDRDSPPRVRL
jgi:hypothetical protein